MAQNQQDVFPVDDDFQTKLPYPVTPHKVKGVYLNPTPPDDFDVNKATQDELTKQGLLWRKPTKDDPPLVQDLWVRFFSRDWKSKDRIVPEFEQQPGRTHNNLRHTPAKQSGPEFTDSAWAGAGAYGGNWTCIVGTWTIPTVTEPPGSPGIGDWNIVSWIGLDGINTSNDVLQVGIEQRLSASGVASCVAWYEWYAPIVSGSPPYVYQTNITNFPVSAGQVVYCSVQYVNNTAGTISFANDSTGQHFSITLAPPPGATFNGSSCEWLAGVPYEGQTISPLPHITPVIFTSAIAGGGTSNIMIPGNADIFNIVNGQGTALTNVTVNGETCTITFI